MSWATFWGLLLGASCIGFAVLAVRVAWRAGFELAEMMRRPPEDDG